MIYTHIANEPITAIEERSQSREQIRCNEKPSGLWYSVDGGWEEWCASEMPGWLERNKVRYTLTLGEERILRLTTEDAIRSFDRQFNKPVYKSLYSPDWESVSAEWDGIEIAPYCWECRLDYMWYYGWDCASGCLWRPRGAVLTRKNDQ